MARPSLVGQLVLVSVLGLSRADMDFEGFKQAFHKEYSSPEEEALRRGIFQMNVEVINSENSKGLGYTLGVNQFSDLSVEEWSSQYFGIRRPAKPYAGATYLGQHKWNGETLPSSVDWTQKGAVTAVKDQGQCGSCWSFSTTGSLEGANFIASKKLVSLSEQQFVDCDKVDSGCQGGLMDNAFQYAEKDAICTEASYPYKGQGGTCEASSCTVGLGKGSVTGYKDVASTEQDLMAAVAQQPVSIAIEADKAVFQQYKSGVLSGMCGASLDHGVLLVGYGTDPEQGDYWKVKNSWGSTWGNAGYVLLKRGKGGTGECGLLSQPSYPQVSVSRWDEFKSTFNKVYNSSVQEAHRQGIFEMNMQLIDEANAKNQGYTLGVNQFSDLSVEEWSSQYFGIRRPAKPYGGATYLGRHTWNGEALPSSVDWTQKGAVTAVKDQGQCGSCWSFSTTGSLEGANFIASKKLVSLSEQQFVDCDKVDSGCQGGLMDNAFQYAEKDAICTEASYPYKGQGGSCAASSCTVGLNKGSVTGYKDVGSTEQDLMAAVAQQPVSIAIEADKAIFQQYKSGVLSGMCGASLDHGVLLVGYGTDPTQGDYWKVKNSWGETWGDEGYVLLKRGKGGTGECGLLTQPSFPQVSSSDSFVV